MEIYLIRHTTPDIEKGICYGNSDIDIKMPIDTELNLILNQLPNTVNAIYTSPLKRCLYLATQLHQKLNTKIIWDDRLKELNFGDWELKNWNNIYEPDLTKWMNNYEVETCPNGESYLDLKFRATTFLNEIQTLNLKNLVIVTHGGFIRTCLSIINKQPLSEIMNQKVDYGCVIKLNLF